MVPELYAGDLAQCMNLKELQFSSILIVEHPDKKSFLPICHIISHVRTPSIRTLVFTLRGADSDNLSRVVAQLGGVAAALSHNRAFGDLGHVMVRLSDIFNPRIDEAVYASVRLTFK